MPRVTFYFDLGSPYAYLSAERIQTVLPEPISWQPILLGGIFKLTGRSSWALGDHDRRQRGMADVEQRTQSYGLPSIRWPDPWPTNYLGAMRAVTFAFTLGKGRELTLQAFRNAFQEGADLSIASSVLDAGEQVGLERGRLEAAMGDPEIKRTLHEATAAAHQAGVFGVPTIAIGEELFWGDDRLQDAGKRLITS